MNSQQLNQQKDVVVKAETAYSLSITKKTVRSECRAKQLRIQQRRRA